MRNYKIIVPGEEQSADPLHDMVLLVLQKMKVKGLVSGYSGNASDQYALAITPSPTASAREVGYVNRAWVEGMETLLTEQEIQNFPLYLAYMANPQNSLTQSPGPLRGLIRNKAFNWFLVTYMEMKLAGEL